MKVDLNLGERFSLLAILPKEGNFATLKIVRQLRETLSLTEDEIKEYGVRMEGEQLLWTPEAAVIEKEFEFGEFAEELMKKTLKELDKNDKLTERDITIYGKIVGEE